MTPKPVSTSAQKATHFTYESLWALGFVLSVLGAHRLLGEETSILAALGATCIVGAVLTGWFVFYARKLKRMDELEQALEMKSLALSCALTIWITTLWGVVSLLSAIQPLPLIFIAPLAASIYGLARLAFAIAYR